MGLDDFVEQATTDSVEVDFSAALDFEALEGEFNFKVIEAAPGTSRAGNPKITVKLIVTAGEHKGKSAVNRKAQKDLPLVGEGSGITKKFLKVADYPGGWETAEAEGIKLSLLKGLEFTGKCRPSKINEDFTDVFAVLPLVGGSDL